MIFSIKPLAILAFATTILSCCSAFKGGNMGNLRVLSHGPYYGKGNGKGGRGKGRSKDHSEHEQLYFDIRLSEGETETVLDNGPMLVFASCNENGTSLVLSMEWDEDLLVFGDTSEDNNLDDLPLVNQTLASEVLLERVLWTQATESEGNDVNDGAVWASTGHYIGWTGDSTIGIHRTDASDLDLGGEDVNCILAGVLNYVYPHDC